MRSIYSKVFRCKNEELPVLCGFVVDALRRDLVDFAAYSPQFNEEYVTSMGTCVQEVKELVSPFIETVEMKVLNDRLYALMDEMVPSMNYLIGYVELAGDTIPLSPADFGLTELRRGVRKRDPENVMKAVRIVDHHIARYRAELEAVMGGENVVDEFLSIGKKIDRFLLERHRIRSNRMAVAMGNMDKLNGLYAQAMQVSRIGKVLYGMTNPAKLKDYTFNHLMKQVRHVADAAEEKKPKEENQDADDNQAQPISA